MRIVMTTTPSAVNVGAVTRDETKGAKSGNSYKDGGFQPSKTTAVARMATSRGSIHLTVGTYELLGAVRHQKGRQLRGWRL